MSELNVKIVKLEPMRVVSTYGFGTHPEEQAWMKLKDWFDSQGPMADLEAHRFFGFNNPSPSAGSPNYGYEQWMTVDPEVKTEDGVQLKSFAGGQYAVAHCTLPVITETWKSLIVWREGSKYVPAQHQWLEECLTPFVPENEMEFDIYLPIAE